MRFKVDENLPVEIADLLREHGHDALTIFDQKMTGAPDPHVANVCQGEQRALVTLDLDFSDIRTYPPHRYPGIVVLRPHSQDRRTVISLMRRLVAALDEAHRASLPIVATQSSRRIMRIAPAP